MTYRAFLLSLVTLALLATMGCSTGRRGGFIIDSGASDTSTDTMDDDTSVILPDSSVRPDTSTPPDTGVVIIMDSGTPDTGTPDTGRPDTGRPDTGTPDTGTPCAQDTVNAVVGAYCDPSADTCAAACPAGDSACLDACFDAGGVDCNACLNVNIRACYNANGCQRPWDLVVCCVDDACGASPTQSCIASAQTGACASQYASLDACSTRVDINVSCPNWYADCF